MLPAHEELRARAARLKLVLTDVDGVLTDAGVFYSAAGEELKRFSLRDGMGVERLREAGVETAMITREKSPIVSRRAEKLRLPWVFLGIWDKREHLPVILEQTGWAVADLGYIGDDVNDLEIIKVIAEQGLTACPEDAVPEVAAAVHYRAAARGGHGAFRAFAEWILALRQAA